MPLKIGKKISNRAIIPSFRLINSHFHMQDRDVQFLVKEGLNKYLRFFICSPTICRWKQKNYFTEFALSFQWLPGLKLNRVISKRAAQKDLCSGSCVMSRLGHSLLVLEHLVPISAPEQVRKGYTKIRSVLCHVGGAILRSLPRKSHSGPVLKMLSVSTLR